MNKSIEFQQPEIMIIESYPSSLGNIDRHVIAFDSRNDLISRTWILKNENNIAEEIYPKLLYKGIYLIHSTSSTGEDINQLGAYNMSSFNRIDCDSVMSYHCIAIKIENDNIFIRTGIHEALLSLKEELPFSFDDMNKISNGYQEIFTNTKLFMNSYYEVMKLWQYPII